MVSYDVELQKGYEAVELASRLCERVQRQLGGDEQQNKDDDSPVTVADYGAQAVVAWCLLRAFPAAFSMVAEEDSAALMGDANRALRERIAALVTEVVREEDPSVTLSVEQVIALIDTGKAAGGAAGRHWVLDPIDGTRGFVGGRQYAVCLGLIDGGEVVVGVLGCPNMPLAALTDADGTAAVTSAGAAAAGVCFAAQKGKGAFFGPLHAMALPVTRMAMAAEQGAAAGFAGARFMESYEARHSQHGLTQQVAERLGITAAALRLDSQCKYGALARGDAGAYMRFPPLGYREKIWDHAAGVVIVTEAGGRVTDAKGNELDFSRGRWLDLEGGGIVGAPPSLHAALVAAVAAVQAEA